MSPDKLRDYRNWYDLNAEQVLVAVQKIKGGWKTIFPKGIPCWLSRLRNYFNVTPHFLIRYDEKRADFIYDWKVVKGGIMESHALSGDAYRDGERRIWLQMATAAGVYHYKGEVNLRKKAVAFIKPQVLMPIFKLISPDGTGGSRELVLTNPKGRILRDGAVGNVAKWEYVRNRVVLQEPYEGSYNFAETITSGYSEHVKADVDTHREWPGFYINPDPDSALKDREFPERDGRGAMLFEQIKYVSAAVNASPKRTNIIPRSLAASSLPPIADPDKM